MNPISGFWPLVLHLRTQELFLSANKIINLAFRVISVVRRLFRLSNRIGMVISHHVGRTFKKPRLTHFVFINGLMLRSAASWLTLRHFRAMVDELPTD